MTTIPTGGIAATFYLCLECGAIREDILRRNGTIAGSRWHDLESEALPSAVTEQARALLDRPRYEQLGLFDDDTRQSLD